MFNFKPWTTFAIALFSTVILSANHARADENEDESGKAAVRPARHANITIGGGGEVNSTHQTDDTSKTTAIQTMPVGRVSARYLTLGEPNIGQASLDARGQYMKDDGTGSHFGFTANGELGGGLSTSSRGLGFIGMLSARGSAKLPPGSDPKAAGSGGLIAEVGGSYTTGYTTALLTFAAAGDAGHDGTMFASVSIGPRFRLLAGNRYYLNLDLFNLGPLKTYKVAAMSVGDIVGTVNRDRQTYKDYATKTEDQVKNGNTTGALQSLKDAKDNKVVFDPAAFVRPMDGGTGQLTFGVGVTKHVAIEGYGALKTVPTSYRTADGTVGEKATTATQFGLTVTLGVH